MSVMRWVVLFYFFFFKQKTAYEMRISDWSSDVCSSDLLVDPVEKTIKPRFLDKRTREFGLDVQKMIGAGVLGHRKVGEIGVSEIGRASCRERVCQYV